MLSVGVMGAICELPLMVTGATSRVRVAPLRSSTEPAEEIVATVVALEEVAVMLPVSLSDPQRVNVNPPVEPVAFCVKITVVPSTTCWMKVPAGMLVPVIGIPAARPAVEAIVMVASPAVVAPPV